MDNIQDFLKTRIPLFKPEWMQTINSMREHQDAPKWNIEIGDRLTEDDFQFVKEFDEKLNNNRNGFDRYPPVEIIEWIREKRENTLYFKEILQNINLEKDFYKIPTLTRSDLSNNLHKIVPLNENLDRLIVNPTTGTTGFPIKAPSHPKTQGCYDPLIQFCLKRYGIIEEYDYNKIAAIQVCFQNDTIVYNTVHSYLNGAGFAKVNLKMSDWRDVESAKRYISDMSPVFISGVPISFIEYLNQKIDYKPRAFLSSALQLSRQLKFEIEERYNCPIIDFYSLNETGPIAFSLPENTDFFQILPNDIYIEVVEQNGKPMNDGEFGEICITGGRNPYFPMIRYRTGDTGAIYYKHNYKDKMPLLKLADTRMPVIFKKKNGEMINCIDIGRILRKYPIYQYQCIQNKNCSLILNINAKNLNLYKEELREDIENLFDNEIDLKVDDNFVTKNGKIITYVSEL